MESGPIDSPWRLLAKTLALLAALGLTGFYAFASRPSLRVVAQLDRGGPAAFGRALDSVDSLLAQAAATGDDPQIEVVVTGQALRQARRSGRLYGRIQKLQTEGVVFAVGQDALRRGRLSEQLFPEGFLVVPSADYEIARLQKRRFAYLRP